MSDLVTTTPRLPEPSLGPRRPLQPEPDIQLSSLVTPILLGWKLIVGSSLLVAAAVVGILLALGRKYEAAVSMTTVVSSRSLSLGGGLASSLLGAGAGMGLQPTPAFVVRLATMPGVVSSVALSPVTPGSTTRIIDRVMEEERSDIPVHRIPEKMAKVVSASFDRPTGVVQIRTEHRDSALARLITERMVAATSEAFSNASRAQARELREALNQRVDSAASRLATAERRLSVFLQANRIVSPFSGLALEQQRLQRELDLAQTVYGQAVQDREAAVAKELEDTPAVVVIDPVPSYVPPVPRKLPLKAILAAMLTAAVVSGVLVASEVMRRNLAAQGAETERFRSALAGVPVLRRLARVG